MPVYFWKGIDLKGVLVQGQFFARSHGDLEKHLFKNQIGLIDASPSWWHRKISPQKRLTFLMHLSALLSAQIPINSAFTIIASTVKRRSLSQEVSKEMLLDCADLMLEGVPLSTALRMHSLADDLTLALLMVGEKTGDSAGVLAKAVEHLTAIDTLRQKVLMSLIGPALTMLFFFIVFFAVVIGVIPRFESYFESYNAVLPFSTRMVLAVSQFFHSAYSIALVGGLLLMSFCIARMTGNTYIRALLDASVIKVPGIKKLYKLIIQARFVTMLSMLIDNGIPLCQALAITKDTLTNGFLSKELAALIALVESGSSLSSALSNSYFADSELEAYVRVGESAGSLNTMLRACAKESQEKLYTSLNHWATYIQPLVILMLGCLIALLICAIYMPLISLSSLV